MVTLHNAGGFAGWLRICLVLLPPAALAFRKRDKALGEGD
ncbi:hypothetical protein C8K44_11043 [Aminobacter sp. AP02]|nr:hypothetical protein C8K44_11043 [Aminobacter sp. AP02]